jgi:hypothetical protein
VELISKICKELKQFNSKKVAQLKMSNKYFSRYTHQAWWDTPVIPALRRLRQEDHKFEVNLDYIARPCV